MIHVIDTIDGTFCKLPHHVDGRPTLKTSQTLAHTTCIECYEAVKLWELRVNEKRAARK